jgi:hypothetical protein
MFTPEGKPQLLEGQKKKGKDEQFCPMMGAISRSKGNT